jgi:hypothetical protein
VGSADPPGRRSRDDPVGRFFNLFEDFRGYIEHFPLQDLVGGDFGSVRFLKDFDDFSGNAVPATSVEEYREYMRRSMAFTQARNKRIAAYATSLTRPAGELLRAQNTAPTLE